MYKVHTYCIIVCTGEQVPFPISLSFWPPIVNLKALKYLDLSRCANIDDWSLSRLHAFGDTLQELSLAGCPQITERGLGTLHHLV